MQSEKQKLYFLCLVNALVFCLIIGVLFFVLPAVSRYGASLAPSRTMTVSAEGKAVVTPDIAEISFSVVTQGKNPQDLAEKNNDKMSAAIQFVKSKDIDAKDLKTTSYDLSPNYRYNYEINRNIITGYTFTQTVFVKVRDLTKVAEVIGGLTPLGVNQIGSVNFTVENQDEALAQARADAFERAQAKAREMADANHVGLGRITSIQDYYSPWPVYTPSAAGRAKFDMGVAEIAAPTIEPGSTEVKINVAVTYELE